MHDAHLKHIINDWVKRCCSLISKHENMRTLYLAYITKVYYSQTTCTTMVYCCIHVIKITYILQKNKMIMRARSRFNTDSLVHRFHLLCNTLLYGVLKYYEDNYQSFKLDI